MMCAIVTLSMGSVVFISKATCDRWHNLQKPLTKITVSIGFRAQNRTILHWECNYSANCVEVLRYKRIR